MTSLVFVTQRIDEGDPVLGFVPSLVGALAERLNRVTVIANAVGDPPTFAPNVSVWSLGRERGAGRATREAHQESHSSVRLPHKIVPPTQIVSWASARTISELQPGGSRL